jgi:hypothetical protein
LPATIWTYAKIILILGEKMSGGEWMNTKRYAVRTQTMGSGLIFSISSLQRGIIAVDKICD